MAKQSKQKQPLTEAQKAERAEKRNKENRERFTRLCPKRVRKFVKVGKQISLCAGVGYVSTPDERLQVLDACRQVLADIEQAYSGKQDESKEFTFKPVQ